MNEVCCLNCRLKMYRVFCLKLSVVLKSGLGESCTILRGMQFDASSFFYRGKLRRDAKFNFAFLNGESLGDILILISLQN